MSDFTFQTGPISASSAGLPSLASPEEQVNIPMEIPVEVPVERPWHQAYFYVKDAMVVNGSPEDEHMYIDICINVGIGSEMGCVNKRLKFCKSTLMSEMKIMDEIKNSKAVYVESKQPEKSTTQRMLELSGIKHPKNFLL